jgi:hypothetical protein
MLNSHTNYQSECPGRDTGDGEKHPYRTGEKNDTEHGSVEQSRD